MKQNGDRPYPGFLFVFEGIDGTGKTTICKNLCDMLVRDGLTVANLREPTSESPWGKEIRTRSPTGSLSPSEELDLFIRDRDWHIKNRILPALTNGSVVLLDRYFFATGAYQNTSTGIPWREILKKNREEINAPEPDIVFLLDVSAEIGLSRVIVSRGEKNEQFE
ncbi:MAG: dTMP kinase [Candidatus Thorarchaeota archaeon]